MKFLHSYSEVNHINEQTGQFKLVIRIVGISYDKFYLKMITVGSLVLTSEIFDESKEIGLIEFHHFADFTTDFFQIVRRFYFLVNWSRKQSMKESQI